MPSPTPTIRKIPRYEDWDFYDDLLVIEINKRLYESNEPMKRSPFVIYPKDVEIILGIPAEQAFEWICYIRNEVAEIKNSFVSPGHFQEFTQLDEEVIKDFIRESGNGTDNYGYSM